MKCSTRQAKYIMDNLPYETRNALSIEEDNAMYDRVLDLEGFQAYGIITHIKAANDARWASRTEEARDQMNEVVGLLREYKVL